MSCIMLVLGVLFIFFVFVKWHRAKNSVNLQQMKFAKNLFKATKDSSFARFSPVKYLIQRFLF